MKTIAFIPARGGSKSIPLKNIKLLCGKPLIYWNISALEKSVSVNEIIVATDSEEITQTVMNFNFSKVKIYKRNLENATDTASTESVMLEHLKQSDLQDDDIFVLVQATSPLTQTEHFEEGLKLYKQNKYDSLLSCVRNYRFFWNEDGTSKNYDYKNRPRRQDFSGQLMENGAFYISTVGNIKKSENRLSGKIGIYEMPEYTAVELDEPRDFLILEQLMNCSPPQKKQHGVKYGKDVNMQFLKRDLEKIKEMIKNSSEFSNENIVCFDEKQNYKCRICHNSNFSKFTNVRGYEYVLCNNCDSIVLLNVPDTKKLYEKKDTKASAIYLDKEVFQRRVETIALPKIKFISEIINKNGFGQWCDVGCGVGELLTGLKQNYSNRFKGVGIEIDPTEISFGLNNGVEIIEGFIDPENTPERIIEIIKKSDVVSMMNVLEHIEKPDKTIDFYKRNMKKGAYLAIEVPRHPSLASFANLIGPELTYRHIVPPVHLQVFSDKAIKMMTEENFKLAGTWGFGQGYTDILTSTMLLGKIKEVELYQSLMDISNDVQKVIDKKGFSDQMIYVLEKI